LKKSPSRSSPADAAIRSAANALKAQQAMGAAAAVIAARTEMAVLACAQPSAEASREMNLMVTEKVETFSKSGSVVAEGAAEMAGRSARYATDEIAAGARAVMELAACRTPAELMEVQAALLTDYLTRSCAFGIGVNALTARTGERALTPVYRALATNSRRLRPTER